MDASVRRVPICPLSRHANAQDDEAWTVLQRALAGNPKLREQALRDDDLGALRDRLRK